MSLNPIPVNLKPSRIDTPIEVPPVLHPDASELSFSVTPATMPNQLVETIYTLPWSGYVERPDERVRLATVARALGSRAIMADAPGMGSGKLDHEERRAVRSGDFTPAAVKQWETLSKRTDTDITMIGYSQGALLAAHLAATAPPGTKVSRLVLWESLGLRRQRTATLGYQVARELRDNMNYLAENPAWFTALRNDAHTLRTIARQLRADSPAYGRGLAQASLFKHLEEAWERETIDTTTSLVVANHADSHLSPLGVNREFVRLVKNRLGLNVVHLLFRGESHNMYDSLPHFQAGLEEIERHLQ